MIAKQKNNILAAILIICIIVLLCYLFSFIFNASFITYAEENNCDRCDEMILQTVTNLYSDRGNICVQIESKRCIYDIFLSTLGYVYEFSFDNTYGYGIVVIDNNGSIKVSEVVLNTFNPYGQSIGKPIYISEFCYALYNNHAYYVLGVDVEMSLGVLMQFFPYYYCGAESLQQISTDIEYLSKTENAFALAQSIPGYISNGLSNSCAPIAGANLVAFFDRYNVNLIPNYNPGNGLGSIYIYKNQNETINNLIDQLYNDMGTNTTGVGTTIQQFKQGLQNYCTQRGYTITFEECLDSSALDWQNMKSGLMDNKPVVMFVEKVNLSVIDEYENMDRYNSLVGYANHTMVGFGFKEITYTKSNNVAETSQFLYVASGLINMPKAYVNIQNNLIIDAAYLVNVN